MDESNKRLTERIARWWSNWREARANVAALQQCGTAEVARMAHDTGLETHELRALAGKWPDSANELNVRLRTLGLDAETISATEPHVLRDLQRTCSMCISKGRCNHDLASDEHAAEWREYCPNVSTLDAMKMESDMNLADKRMRRRLRAAGKS